MFTAMVFLLAGALGAQPASGATGARTDSSAAGANAAEILTARTEDGEVRLNLSGVRFDRESRAGAASTVAGGALAETPEGKNALATTIVAPPAPSRERLVKAAIDEHSTRAWLALAFAEHGAAAFDAYSTRISVGHGNVEEDPLMKPFAHSAAIYAATQVTPFVMDFVARRMQRSENPFLRRVWWMPQSMEMGLSIFAGVHNLRIANTAR
jgi:hypothetical protein